MNTLPKTLSTIAITGAAWSSQAQVNTFQQQLTIEPAVAVGQIEVLPVLNGKDWAFTARWDDNHANALNMHQAMIDIGIQGTFYLNGSNDTIDAEAARQLASAGCSIGGHTVHHYWLTTLNPNAIFSEIMLNRIEREAETDQPINSFAFPFGTYWDAKDPTIQGDITDALIRSGYHHSVYSHFVRKSHYMPDGLFSTMNQVVPGDRKINAEKFRESMQDILDHPEKYKAIDHSISLGVHPWQPAEELEKFKTLIAEYAHRDDFWYCSQTQFAAYRLSATHTQFDSDTSAPGTLTVTRPTVASAGFDTPLSIAIAGDQPKAVTLDGVRLETTALPNGRWLVNLPFTQDQAMPTRIDWLHFEDPASQTAAHSNEVPGLAFGFSRNNDGQYELAITNESTQPAASIVATLRKPTFYEQGVDQQTLENLEPGQSQNLRFDAGSVRDGIRYVQGKSVVAAELLIVRAGRTDKVYLTLDEMGPEATPSQQEQMIRDHARFVGPVDAEAFDFGSVVGQSQRSAELSPLSDSLLMQWRSITPRYAETFAYNRIDTFVNERDWRAAAEPVAKNDAWLLIALDFEAPQAGTLQFDSQLPLVQLAVDGKRVALTDGQPADAIDAGKHRLIAAVDTQGKFVTYKAKPFYMAITVDQQPVRYLQP